MDFKELVGSDTTKCYIASSCGRIYHEEFSTFKDGEYEFLKTGGGLKFPLIDKTLNASHVCLNAFYVEDIDFSVTNYIICTTREEAQSISDKVISEIQRHNSEIS